MQTPAISAVATLGGLSIQVMASRHHQNPARAATVALIVPIGPQQASAYAQPARILHLDSMSARVLARHLNTYANEAEVANAGPQTEREALMAAITPQDLDAAVSDLVGLS